MHSRKFRGFTLIELIIVIAIIAIIAAIVISTLGTRESAECQKHISDIKKELQTAEETATKLYKGEGGVTDTDLNTQLGHVTEHLKKLPPCGVGNAALLSQIGTLTAELQQYVHSDVPDAEKTELDKFINLLGDLKEKLTK
jgi:prepilin-type N-terminal cleavage/methylation domain-containing protein